MILDEVSVSVVMATFCGEKFLAQQLESILLQSVSPSEIIVVDDCSIDTTWDILCEFAKIYSQIKIYRNDVNIGVVKTFERGVTLSTCNYIALSDQDDYWMPNKLEVLINNIGDNWLIHSDAYVVDERLDIISESYSSIKPYHDNSMEMYYLRNNVTGCTVLMKKKLLELVLPFPENLAMHDYYLALCAKAYGKLVYTSHKLVKYRQHENNVVGSSLMQSYELMLSTFKKQVKFLDGLQQLSIFKFDVKQIEVSKDYFVSITTCKLPKLKTFYLIYKKFGVPSVISMLLYTIINQKFAKFYFELRCK